MVAWSCCLWTLGKAEHHGKEYVTKEAYLHGGQEAEREGE
jgi:hypothetical protein